MMNIKIGALVRRGPTGLTAEQLQYLGENGEAAQELFETIDERCAAARLAAEDARSLLSELATAQVGLVELQEALAVQAQEIADQVAAVARAKQILLDLAADLETTSTQH